MTASQPQPAPPRPARLWTRSFALWLLGSAQSQLGSALAGIALSFLVLHQTGSAGQMAITLALSIAPNLLMPLAGALVDRLPLKVPLIGADLARGLLQLGVAGLALHSGQIPLWVIDAAALLGGFAGIFAAPASSAALPRLVPREQLARANGLLGSVTQGAFLTGTLAGGLLVARLGPPAAIGLDGVSFLVVAALLAFVRLPSCSEETGPRVGLLQGVRAGLRLMRRSRVLSLLPFIALVLNAAIAPVTVIVPKLLVTLGPGAAGYGVFLALEGLGGVLAGVVIAWAGARLPGKRATAAGMLLMALAFVLMGGWTHYPALLAGSFIVGASASLINIPLSTLIQRMVPADYLGRVSSVNGTVGTLGMPLALLIVSPLVDRSPPALFFAVAAGLMLAGAVAWALVARAERTPPDLHAWARDGAVPERAGA